MHRRPRRDTASQRARLDEHHPFARLGEQHGCGQSGHSTTDDRDVDLDVFLEAREGRRRSNRIGPK
jgi:hypothetical protein